MKKIFKINFLFLIIFLLGNFFSTALAQDGVPIITYTLNGSSSNITTNPLINPVQIGFVSDENIENWVSVKIVNNNDSSIYKNFIPGASCDGTSQCSETWSGEISPSDKTLVDGTYSVIVHIKNITGITFDLTLTSLYTITVDTFVPPEPTSTFIIRNGDTVIYQNTVPLLADKSVLATLQSIDATSDAFSISNVQDYSFGKYLKCILPANETELCDNWQFSVGSISPFTSIDTTMLSGGETVGIYFGNSHKLILDKNTINSGESLNATAQKYNYEDNSWNPLTSVSVGVTLPNPDDQWNPTVVSTHPVDTLGVANITITDANTYTLGIVEDFYFTAYTVTVSNPPSGGSGGGGGGYIPLTFDTQKALDYLKSVQAPDGSFGDSDLYTDWAGIALVSQSVDGSYREKILAYFNSHNTISTLLTDNERRTMALLSLGENPYSFNGVNYIDAITKSFDGTQFGDINLINDDIFALIPLKNSGYTENDEIIIKDIAYLISKQKTNGSFEESIDITAATIQALKSFEKIAGVSDAIAKAKNYLINEQKTDGGWDNVSSTSWVMQAMGALSESWTKSGFTPSNYLGKRQALDGAMSTLSDTLSNRIWTTSYTIIASTLKPWSEIMQTVSKPEIKANLNNQITDEKITPILKTQELKTTPKKLSVNTIKINPETLTASAINSTPAKTNIPIKLPAQAIPAILGFFSGAAVVFFFGKFFIL